ncbi:hypothetical protein FALCPG4_000642 [Fusarium falciforme]
MTQMKTLNKAIKLVRHEKRERAQRGRQYEEGEQALVLRTSVEAGKMELTGESLESARKKKTNQNNRGICRVAPKMERREIMHTRPEKEERKNKRLCFAFCLAGCG